MKSISRKIHGGDVFQLRCGGMCVVIENGGSNKIIIEHLDKYQHRATVGAGQLRSGRIKNPYNPHIFNVGFFGTGDYRASIGGKMTPAYKTWYNMMRRCYCPDFKGKYPTYQYSVVNEEWHNFQIFADWYYSEPNNSKKGFDLDKDLMYIGNKIYSSSTCSLIPAEINTLLLDCGASRGNLPQGVYFNKDKNKYQSQIKIDGKSTSLGRYLTADEAHLAYKTAKRENVIRMAEKHRAVLHPQVYENLKNWTL